jgi:hypothetical protein
MTIEGKDFKLSPVNEYSVNWDLELLYKISPKGKEPRYEFKNAGYGYTLEHAMKAIINFRINNKYADKAITMREYLDEYHREVEELNKLLK